MNDQTIPIPDPPAAPSAEQLGPDFGTFPATFAEPVSDEVYQLDEEPLT